MPDNSEHTEFSQFFTDFDGFVLASLLRYLSRSGDFCGDDDDNDNNRPTDRRQTKPIALSLAHACGVINQFVFYLHVGDWVISTPKIASTANKT